MYEAKKEVEKWQKIVNFNFHIEEIVFLNDSHLGFYNRFYENVKMIIFRVGKSVKEKKN